jgi:hypothetical protein
MPLMPLKESFPDDHKTRVEIHTARMSPSEFGPVFAVRK